MLFYISEPVVDLAANGDREVIDTLYSLGYFWRTGCCLVDARRRDLLRLEAIESLKESFELIKDQKQNVTGLYKEIDFFVVLQAVDGQSDLVIDRAIGRSVSIEKFKNRIKFGLNIVLCENIRDYDFYKWGAVFFSDIDKNVFKINTLGYNGGGAVIVESAKHIQDYPSLVICDNDKKYPTDNEGKTLEGLRRFLLSNRPLLMWNYELNVHEVENLVPLDLLRKAYGTKGLVDKMRKAKTNANYGLFFSYFDFKEGFKKSTLRKMNKDIASSYNGFITMLRLLAVSQKSIDSTLASTYKKGEDSLLSGLGGELMRYVNDFINNNFIDRSSINIDSHQIVDWGNIKRKIWSVGCANVPRRL